MTRMYFISQFVRRCSVSAAGSRVCVTRLLRVSSPPGCCRGIQTSSTHNSATDSVVELAYSVYDEHKPDNSTDTPNPLLILHGLFGHKGNWKSLASLLNQSTKRQVITVDARNHGDSPWSEEINFYVMVDDVQHLIKKLGLKTPAVLGHSMGGRTAMCLALVHPLDVEKVIVVDVAPRKSRSTLEDIPAYLRCMKEVKFDHNKQLSEVKMEVDEQLKEVIVDEEVRQFIIKNLVGSSPDGSGTVRWMLNIDSIADNIKHLQRMPTFNRAYHADALFIGGTRSLGLTKADYPAIMRLFPRAQINHVEGAGHWVHVDKPERFEKLVVEFLNQPVTL